MSRSGLIGTAAILVLSLGCNSDVPVSATTEVSAIGVNVTVTRVATHPFLARFNLKLKVSGPGGCSASSDLFPDTGGVSRRNLYVGVSGRLYVIGQYDARAFDAESCSVALREFRSLDEEMQYVGVFDVNDKGKWSFLQAVVRPERPFEKL